MNGLHLLVRGAPDFGSNVFGFSLINFDRRQSAEMKCALLESLHVLSF